MRTFYARPRLSVYCTIAIHTYISINLIVHMLWLLIILYLHYREEWTEEEKQRHQEIGRRCNVMSMIEHNHFMRDVQTKIDLKWEAINALPAELQAEAMEIDDAPIPEERTMATWTPPIPGFRRYTDEGEETTG